MPISVVLFLSRRLQAVAAALLLLSALQAAHAARSAGQGGDLDAGPRSPAIRGILQR